MKIEQLDDKIGRMDANQEVIQIAREMTKRDVPEILLSCHPLTDPDIISFQKENANIAANAMVDLLCIMYHSYAQKMIPGYTLTYEDLCQKV